MKFYKKPDFTIWCHPIDNDKAEKLVMAILNTNDNLTFHIMHNDRMKEGKFSIFDREGKGSSLKITLKVY